ncbi:MAG: HAMP domain-containing histidine kinase [Lewinellaceae bacterium]|nr:HAMP domain-containing histidine kinase [Lewinellaceae bacterium]
MRDQCRKDFDCLYQTYMTVMINLERRFNLPAAIYVGEEIVNITQQQGGAGSGNGSPPEPERKQIDFSLTLSMADKVVAHIDPEKCRQILFNLRSNAFKFTPVGGQIATKNSLENGRLHLAASDTGPGIHPDGLPHVFDRFFQTTRPDKPAEGGTGIGLNLCQEYRPVVWRNHRRGKRTWRRFCFSGSVSGEAGGYVQRHTSFAPTVQRNTSFAPTVQRNTSFAPTVQRNTSFAPTVQRNTSFATSLRRNWCFAVQ